MTAVYHYNYKPGDLLRHKELGCVPLSFRAQHMITAEEDCFVIDYDADTDVLDVLAATGRHTRHIGRLLTSDYDIVYHETT